MAVGPLANISIQRATILMAMSRSWTALGNQIIRYESMAAEERHMAPSVSGRFPIF